MNQFYCHYLDSNTIQSVKRLVDSNQIESVSTPNTDDPRMIELNNLIRFLLANKSH